MSEQFIRLTSKEANARLVLLHGWGADSEDLIPIGQQINKDFVGGQLEIVALRAPNFCSEGDGREWYGLFPSDWDAVPSAIKSLETRIADLGTGRIPLNKTIVLGFSQGGAMAINTGCNLPLAGLIGCSAYPHPGWIPPKERPPVLLTHGIRDQIVPLTASEKLLNCFQTNVDVKSELVVFEGGHEIPPELFVKFSSALKTWLI